MSIFWISDLHLGHKNIVRGVSSWKDGKGCRDFDTINEHDMAIIDGINLHVNEDDTLYILGDFVFSSSVSIWTAYRNAINCKNVYLIIGNHDMRMRKKEGVKELFAGMYDIKQGGFHINGRKQSIFMSHYAHRVWNNSHHGAWMLFGHSHNTLPTYRYNARRGIGRRIFPKWIYPKTLDVSVESAIQIFGQIKPFSLNELEIYFSHPRFRRDTVLDHHTTNTQ